MPVLRVTVLVDAPARTVAGVLRDSEPLDAALRSCGHRLSVPGRFIARDDELAFRLRVAPGLRLPLTTRVVHAAQTELVSTLGRGRLRELVHRTTLTVTLAGTLVTDEVAWRTSFGVVGRVAEVAVLRRLVLRLLVARADAVRRVAEALRDPDVVVGAALVRDGRLLVARRARPAAVAGRWELPGGRVEPGEDESAALVRECREELGVGVQPDGRVGPDLPLSATAVLRVHAARLAGEPRPLEHAELRWAAADELADLNWCDADRALVADLRALLGHPTPGAAGPSPPGVR